LRRRRVRSVVEVADYGPVTGAIAELLAANERAGTIRPGIDPEQFLFAVGGLWQLHANEDWQPRGQKRHALQVVGEGDAADPGLCAGEAA
jgi:hypothetical protein